MSVTRAQILSVAPDAEPYVDALLRQMRDAAITSPLRAAHFLAQFYVESAGFARMVENLNYSVGALKTMFGRHRISAEDAERLGRKKGQPANQMAIANTLYGGSWGAENLGNTQPGDGWKFRARGAGITGRDNYERFSRAWLGSDALLANPGQVAEPAGAVASAIWFWHSRGLNAVADRNSVEQVTRLWNGGQNGLDERREMTQRFLQAFQP